jgi:hypothetical protein
MNAIVRSAAKVAAVLLLVPACAGAAHSVSWDENGLNYYFATTKDTFVMYENVPMEYIVTNTSDDTLAVWLSCYYHLPDIEFGVWGPGNPWHPDSILYYSTGCADSPWLDYEFAPGEAYAKQVNWGMTDPQHNTLIRRGGTHRLVGMFFAELYPSQQRIDHNFSLEIEILSGAAGAPEPMGSWGAIKALYR